MMKFKEYFEQNLLSEWKDFYLNYLNRCRKKILNFFKIDLSVSLSNKYKIA